MEVESALVSHPKVAEAAVVGKPHEIKGEAVFAFVVLRGARPGRDTSALTKELRDWVAEQVGAIAKPDEIRFADNLPKTRSGKIMRRLLKSVARGEEITQDVSTLENPAILEQLRGGEAPRAPANKPARKAAAKRRRPARKAVKKAPRKRAAAAKPRPKAKPARVRRAAARRKMRGKMARKVTRRAVRKVARRPAKHR
jgi:AMP-binding enzyme